MSNKKDLFDNVCEAVLIYMGGVYTKKVCRRWEAIVGDPKMNPAILRNFIEKARQENAQ